MWILANTKARKRMGLMNHRSTLHPKAGVSEHGVATNLDVQQLLQAKPAPQVTRFWVAGLTGFRGFGVSGL